MSLSITIAPDTESPATDDNITVDLSSMGSYDHGDYYISSGTAPSITISDFSGTTHSNTWTGTGLYDSSWIRPQGKLTLEGDNADIEINGESLVGMLKSIQERVNILTVNPELESEWADLKALGDQYRALEKHILEKQATWDRLKAMPPPVID